LVLLPTQTHTHPIVMEEADGVVHSVSELIVDQPDSLEKDAKLVDDREGDRHQHQNFRAAERKRMDGPKIGAFVPWFLLVNPRCSSLFKSRNSSYMCYLKEM